MFDSFGSIVWQSNGYSHIKFDLGVETYAIMGREVEARFVFY